MTLDEYKYNLNRLRKTCAMNELYHQRMEWRCTAWDRGIRIAVMVLAVAGLVFAMPNLTDPWVGFEVAVAALVVAAVLNIVQVGEWAKSHGEQFRLWCDLRGDADREHLKTCDLEDDDKVPLARSARQEELWDKVPTRNAAQTAAWQTLLKKCEIEANRQIDGDPCPSVTSDPSAPVVSGAGLED